MANDKWRLLWGYFKENLEELRRMKSADEGAKEALTAALSIMSMMEGGDKQ